MIVSVSELLWWVNKFTHLMGLGLPGAWYVLSQCWWMFSSFHGDVVAE